MAVYKHKNGRWYYKLQIRGIRYHKAIPEAIDKKSAENAETKIKSELLSGRFDLIENKKEMTFFQLCDRFQEFAHNNRVNHAKDTGIVKKLKNFYGNCLLTDFVPFAVERYRTKRKKEGYKPATINKETGILRRMFNIAVDNGWMTTNCALKRFVKPMTVENAAVKILTTAEEQALLNACVGDCAYMRPIIMCALYAGLRKSEILTLKWANVDLEKGIITLLVQKNSKKSDIPMSGLLKAEFEKLHKNKTSAYVFVNPETNEPYVNIRKTYTKALRIAGITDFTFHALRHTACTRMLELGIGVDVVQEILRHSTPAITLAVYNHINQDRKFAAVQRLADYKKVQGL